MNRRIRFLVGSLVVIGWAGVGWGDDQSQQGEATASPSMEEQAATPNADTPPTDESAAPSAQTAASGTEPAPAAAVTEQAPGNPSAVVSVDFKEADIRQVLRVLSLKSGVDIVAGSDVEGVVSIKLTNVPWEEALAIILRTYGFTYERNGNIVRVLTVKSKESEEDARVKAQEQEPLTTNVFPLDYAKAKDVPDVIKEMLSDRGRIKYDERTNTIIVTDISTILAQIKQVIGRLDQRTPQVLIETKVVETRLSKDEKLGIDWSDSLTLSASAASLPSTFPFPGGADLGLLSSFVPRTGTFSPATGASLPRGRVPEVGGTFTFGTLSSTGLSSVLNFLQSRTDTHIVSNPTISALNNQEARIHIGEEYPIPNFSIDPSTGRTTITGYTPKNIGTVLDVTPHVNPSSEIVVDMKPEVIAFTANVTYDTGAGNSVSLPRFTTQTAQTQVRIRDNETVAIGGLVKQTERKSEVKVPVLGDIPIIGLLFKNTTRYGGSDPVRQDLLVFLTVRLMQEAPASHQAVAAAPPAEYQ